MTEIGNFVLNIPVANFGLQWFITKVNALIFRYSPLTRRLDICLNLWVLTLNSKFLPLCPNQSIVKVNTLIVWVLLKIGRFRPNIPKSTFFPKLGVLTVNFFNFRADCVYLTMYNCSCDLSWAIDSNSEYQLPSKEIFDEISHRNTVLDSE